MRSSGKERIIASTMPLCPEHGGVISSLWAKLVNLMQCCEVIFSVLEKRICINGKALTCSEVSFGI